MAKADEEQRNHDNDELALIKASDEHDKAHMLEERAEKLHELELKKHKVAMSIKTWEEQQFVLSMQQD